MRVKALRTPKADRVPQIPKLVAALAAHGADISPTTSRRLAACCASAIVLLWIGLRTHHTLTHCGSHPPDVRYIVGDIPSPPPEHATLRAVGAKARKWAVHGLQRECPRDIAVVRYTSCDTWGAQV